MYKKKVARDLGPNPHTAPRIRKEVLTPPRHPPQKGVPGYGGLKGSETKNFHWGIIFSPKMMILQGVGHPVPYLGVSYANDPKKGGVYGVHTCAWSNNPLRGDLKYTAMHQQQCLVQPANTRENLNIQPSRKIWKTEGDGSLAPPLTRQGCSLGKGGGG